eukprot:Phypoly_transcript_00945.p1 GENE.Phypoly_transcript_00945~~Phypoly_transcript_00945.p1  ORF type:complete len:1032 (+),score=176.72 Phypoly_transcript_00945:541-3636(+)
MDKVRKMASSDSAFPNLNANNNNNYSELSISPPPYSTSYIPAVSSGIDQQLLNAFLAMLTKLEIISLPPYATKITQLTKYASMMVNLQKLRVEGLPDITSLATEITSLKSLEEFHLVKLGLKTFPPEILMMTKLREIDISYNAVASFPSRGMATLTNLEKLILGGNQISSLPADFHALKCLKYLDLQKNKFEINTITPILVDLCSPSSSSPNVGGSASPTLQRDLPGADLQTLIFSGNKAACLPLSFAKLSCLTYLDVSSNEMSLWPNEVLQSLVNLKVLNLSQNHITHLPHDLPSIPSLTRISLSGNQLKKIPTQFCLKFPNITELDLSANKISSLPESFKNLTNLRILNISTNEFAGEIPPTILQVPALTEVDVSHNSCDLWWTDDAALLRMKSLVKLNLAANKLTHVGPGIGHLTTLLSLNLSHNILAALPSEIGNLTTLEHLHLHSNPSMEALPSEFSLLTKLTKLSIGNVTISDYAVDIVDGGQVDLLNKEIEAVDGEQVNLMLLTRIAKSAPHPLVVIAMGILCERDELHQQLLDTGTIHVLVEFTSSPHFDIKLDATKSLCVLSINENLREDLFGAASARLMELVESDNVQIQTFALTTLGNIAFKDTVRLGLVVKYGVDLFKKVARDTTLDISVRKKSRRVLAILGINDFFLSRNPKTKGVRILTIDGGGTRGVVAIEFMKKFEELSGKRMHELFDLAGGTSTGAQLCAAMSVRQLPLLEYERMYIEQCASVFTTTISAQPAQAATVAATAAADATSSNTSSSATAPASSSSSGWSSALSSQWAKISLYSNVLTTGAFYKSKNLEDALVAFFEDRILIDTVEDYDLRFFGLSTLVNTLPSQPFVFRNYEYPPESRSRYSGSCTSRIWQAMRASTAAPSYFDEFTMGTDRFQDGGIVANNPTAVAFHEAKKIWGPDVKIECMVSLGTGRPPSKPTKNSIKDTIITLVDSATSTERVHEVMEDVLPPGRYFRINPTDEAFSVELDETRPDKLEAMQIAARKFCLENEHLFRDAVKLLLGENDTDE